ncbi:MAG: peptide ABC transporter substrate-binding protein, partial [Bacillota bacterium]|nr:peptide ABC transporter substrate-binding protein [Bacillota bacterium]
TPYFLSLAAFPTLFPVNKKVVEANPDGWALKPETYVTNGPFKMVEWVHNNRIVAVKNERYWDAKNVKLSKVIFTLVEDHATELTLWETDQIEITDQVPPQEIERLRREKKLKSSPYIAVYYYIFNVEKKPLDDPRVRKALAYAIDRQAIVEKVVKGGQKPALAFAPYGLPDAQPGQDFRQVGGDYFKDNDVETARKLLAEAGYPNGRGFPTIEILYNTLESHKAVAEAIQEMWKRNLGINATLTNQEWKVYLQSRDEGNFQVARAGWVGDYLDPMTFMDVHVTGGGNNDSNYSNPKYDQLIETAKNSGDPRVRMKALHDAEKILMEDMPIMPIYFYVNLFLEKDYVHDVIHSALGFVDFKNAWISRH